MGIGYALDGYLLECGERWGSLVVLRPGRNRHYQRRGFDRNFEPARQGQNFSVSGKRDLAIGFDFKVSRPHPEDISPAARPQAKRARNRQQVSR